VGKISVSDMFRKRGDSESPRYTSGGEHQREETEDVFPMGREPKP